MHRTIIAAAMAGAAVLAAIPAIGARAAVPVAVSETSQVTAVQRTGESWPVFQRGDQNEGVRSLRYLLRGYRLLPATESAVPASDGFDAATEKAVSAFENRRGLPDTGKVDDPVWNSISRDITTKPIGAGYGNTEFVKATQNMVNTFTAKCGNAPLTVDGEFGPQTDTAVKQVQKCQGQAADGYVGPQTFHTLVANY